MRKLRLVLKSMLAVVGCSALLVVPIANASTTYDIKAATISAGSTTLWYPTSNNSGFNLTNGGTQKMNYYFSESGNALAMGFQQTSSGTKYSWYSGTLSGSSKSVSKVLTGTSGYYKAYLTNNNKTVSISVLDSSTVEVD